MNAVLTPWGSSIAAGGRESQCQERFLLEFVRFGRASRRAGARRALHRAHLKTLGLGQTFEPRQYVEKRSHVRGLFLDPDDFPGLGMLGQSGRNFRPRQRIGLVKEKDGCAAVLAAAAFAAKFVTHLPAGDQYTLCV